MVQLVAHGPLEPRILVRVQAPEPLLTFLRAQLKLLRAIPGFSTNGKSIEREQVSVRSEEQTSDTSE